MSESKKPFPGYFTGNMEFYDGMGILIAEAPDLYFLYQFRNGMFGTRYLQAQVVRQGVIMTFIVYVDQLGFSRTGSIGLDLGCDIRMPVFPAPKGGVFWLQNFFFGVTPNPPQEIKDFVAEMGIIKAD